MGAIAFILLSLGVAVTALNNCGPVSPEVGNGFVEYVNGTELGAKAVIKCKIGFNLIGSKELSCGEQGWSGRPPVCEVVSCLPPPAVANAEYNPEKESYDYSQVVIYSCEGDYTLKGASQLKCAEDGSFRPAPPKCVRVECEDLQFKNGEVTEGSRPPYGRGAFLNFKCNKGYTLEGPSTVTCDINSKWSAIPQCKAGNTGNAGNSLAAGAGIGTFVSIAVLCVQLFWM
ncbi:membrane cofactor protein-like [Odontesthes bonariensis]|uniref:membrane cofactor protein-like n=1 Tax=Odontesthes bonariensis TaxID=219752 RepID=UPI003F5856D8